MGHAWHSKEHDRGPLLRGKGTTGPWNNPESADQGPVTACGRRETGSFFSPVRFRSRIRPAAEKCACPRRPA